jgi:hypothetical protein
LVSLHPRLADIYQDKVERLQESLNADGTRGEAAEALRDLIDFPPGTQEFKQLGGHLDASLGAAVELALAQEGDGVAQGELAPGRLIEQAVKLVADGRQVQPVTVEIQASQ